ncbi:MAG: RodZ domain-containing protein [Nocardioidaceae bacterium]
MPVEVRRRGWLMLPVAAAAAVLAALYLWRFTETQGVGSLLLGVLLGGIAVVHGGAWRGTRTPLLVADATGLRVRLGGRWAGVRWEDLERVEVDRRGRLTDGHITVIATDETGVLAAASVRGRLTVAFNRWVYDSPLVVPYGASTKVSVDDVAGSLRRLSGDRASVVATDVESDEPQPTVEITGAAGPDPADPDPDDFGADEHESAPPTPVWSYTEPAGSAGPPRTATFAAREGHAARRAEVTLPAGAERTTAGTLALSEQPGTATTEPLPEVAHLRRVNDEDVPERADNADNADNADTAGNAGNVALIIDATTGMSARAMTKVHRPAPPAAELGDGLGHEDGAASHRVAEVAPAPAHEGPLVIGDEVAQAREHLRLTVDDLAERTRIRPYVIESIELDDFAPCGGDFYARGHLRMLSRVLGIAADPLLTAYDDRFATAPVNPKAVFDVERATGNSGMVRGTTGGPNWGALVGVVLLLLLVWGVARFFTAGDDADTTTAPAHNAAGLGSPGVGNQAQAPVRAKVTVHAVGGTSRVVVWDSAMKQVFAGRLHPGQSRQVSGKAPLRVMAVDGGVVSLTVRGHDRGLMGDPSQRVFTHVRAKH